MKSTAGLEWGTHVGVIETLLNNTRKQAESALKSLAKFRSNPQKYKPQLQNVVEMLNTWRGVSRRGLQHIERLEKALTDDVGASVTGAAGHDKEIIRTLVKAGNDELAKTFARSRGYRVKAVGRIPPDVARSLNKALDNPKLKKMWDEASDAMRTWVESGQRDNKAHRTATRLTEKLAKKAGVKHSDTMSALQHSAKPRAAPAPEKDKDVDPQKYHKEHGRCPDGYQYDGKRCVEA